MNQYLSWTETWYKRGLWVVACIFAWFLVGLGGLLLNRLPGSHTQFSPFAFMQDIAVQTAQERIKSAQQNLNQLKNLIALAQQQVNANRIEYTNSRKTFDNWLETKKATNQSVSDAEILEHNRVLDNLMHKQQTSEQNLAQLQQRELTANEQLQKETANYQEVVKASAEQANDSHQWLEYKAFLIRFGLTAPLLLIAIWLFLKKRQHRYWPFVWGYIFFAVHTFFFELYPYLPDLGLYMRYLVGIAATLIIGRATINAMQRYLEKQRAAEKLSESERRQTLDYELIQNRLAKQVCPGCERPMPSDEAKVRNFCTHCGIRLFENCASCQSRKNTFDHFCHHCGSTTQPEPSTSRPG